MKDKHVRLKDFLNENDKNIDSSKKEFKTAVFKKLYEKSLEKIENLKMEIGSTIIQHKTCSPK